MATPIPQVCALDKLFAGTILEVRVQNTLIIPASGSQQQLWRMHKVPCCCDTGEEHHASVTQVESTMLL